MSSLLMTRFPLVVRLVLQPLCSCEPDELVFSTLLIYQGGGCFASGVVPLPRLVFRSAPFDGLLGRFGVGGLSGGVPLSFPPPF